jgi:hypothetical protein
MRGRTGLDQSPDIQQGFCPEERLNAFLFFAVGFIHEEGPMVVTAIEVEIELIE